MKNVAGNRRLEAEEKTTGLNAANCRRHQCPQPVLQLVDAQELQSDFPPAKADINRWVFLDLQAGQTTFNFSSIDRNSISNSFLHFLHWNS
jgi:hypothetical protein